MDAVILAAGAGTRLRPLTASCPKCLVGIDDLTLLDHQILALVAAGVDVVHLVVGYRSQMVRDHCEDGDRYGVRIRYVDNADWERTNSIFSLYLAREGWSEEGTFLCNCDILFDARLPYRLAQASGSGIAVDTERPRLVGEMNVRVDAQGRVEAISKQLDPETTQAVSVQIILLRDGDGSQVVEEVVRFVEAAQIDTFPTAAYGPLVEARRLSVVDMADLPWAEIDSVEEHTQACRTCAPLLQRPGGARSA
ncbi:MAG: phosphocholine cytidylyltransferase family protein [Gemmatimonadetes bacterium]|nr:phosphocholine cytidylyltransferase family protein [Gemmatimonadota bacterium]MBT6149775.1 phosphocholine cytidylyltransferase family protein [Gemmatimonadota bacterium]MBT7860764.1 phosphocholine cytidylyltransferase family protein [Gemmatimonadota bacterium]